jgi:hypothetical protein
MSHAILTLVIGLSVVDSVGLPLVLDSSQFTNQNAIE